jgi:hypothetical protein
MRTRIRRIAVLLVAAAALVAGSVVVGRATVDTDSVRAKGYQAGRDAGYFDGLRVGGVQGRQEGRALQEGQALPATARRPVHDAFDAGYTSGTNDAFAGYDGGWALGAPYVIVVEEGSGPITYRIKSREPVKRGVNYFLCADGRSLCEGSRR